jgi:hypothetical protein
MAVVDVVRPADRSEHGIVAVEEPVAVAQRLELPLPDRELELAELGPGDMTLGDHPDERVELVDASVDRVQPRGERRAADADDCVLLRFVALDRDGLAVYVLQLHEVEDVRVVERVAAAQHAPGEAGSALAGDRRERRLRREPVGLAQIVVGRHPVIAAALDVDRAEILNG